MAEGRNPETETEAGRDVPGGGTTRNTGGRRTGIWDAHGRPAGWRAGGDRGRWAVPAAFVLLLLALLLATVAG